MDKARLDNGLLNLSKFNTQTMNLDLVILSAEALDISVREPACEIARAVEVIN